MGVCIWKCNKDQDNVVKDSSIDCYKKTDQSNYINIITSNNINNKTQYYNESLIDKKLIKMKYRKMFNDNREKSSQRIQKNSKNNNNAKVIKNVIKIQTFYRNYFRRKKEKNEKEKIEAEQKEKDKDKDKEDSDSFG